MQRGRLVQKITRQMCRKKCSKLTLVVSNFRLYLCGYFDPPRKLPSNPLLIIFIQFLPKLFKWAHLNESPSDAVNTWGEIE